MTNYIIDGNINFYEELMKNEEIDENNVCLLSNLPLDETHIELPCSHKFNYIYIYNEVKTSKKQNSLNIGYSNNYLINNNEIMCPYCRKRFNFLLPPCKNIEGCSLLKNVNKCNNSIPIKCKDVYNNCESPVYVTNIGYYCMRHYKEHTKILKPKKCNNKKNNTKHIHSSMNMIMDSSMNMVMNSSYSIKVYVTVDLINNIIDVSELKHNISKKYTINALKTILKQNNLRISGIKDELIQRIIDNHLYEIV